MMNCWLKDVATLRHSRQHCIEQYGTNFVRDELPSLLRADGLPEEDVLRLTEYGGDMDPPPPRSFWEEADEYGAGSETEESGADGGELSGDGADDDDGDSDAEKSDGWATADEG